MKINFKFIRLKCITGSKFIGVLYTFKKHGKKDFLGLGELKKWYVALGSRQ